MPKERGEDGQYRTTVDAPDVLEILDAVRGPVLTSADVAERLGVSRETARRKLNGLVDAGDLAKRKTAGRVVYWRDEEPDPPAGERDVSAMSAAAARERLEEDDGDPEREGGDSA
jgi:DeoR/GlpR family transcriptional regulator of sugar metabolism